MAFLTIEQLWGLGLKHIGANVLISERAVFYNPGKISIGDNSRIDDFVILSAGDGIEIGRYVHIACYAHIVGKGKVVMDDYSAISGKCCVYSSTDSYNGEFMTNPCTPEAVRNTIHKPVHFGRHVVVGAGSVVLPGVVLCEGSAVGALSLVSCDVPPGMIYAGVPAKFIAVRKRGIYEFEKMIPAK